MGETTYLYSSICICYVIHTTNRNIGRPHFITPFQSTHLSYSNYTDLGHIGHMYISISPEYPISTAIHRISQCKMVGVEGHNLCVVSSMPLDEIYRSITYPSAPPLKPPTHPFSSPHRLPIPTHSNSTSRGPYIYSPYWKWSHK